MKLGKMVSAYNLSSQKAKEGSQVAGQLGLHSDPVSKKRKEMVPVAHTCNPSYSGGRDQEDRGLKPAQAQFMRPYLEKKKGLRCRP
jgi:hypothetical protein